jgi:hypothetical protein
VHGSWDHGCHSLMGIQRGSGLTRTRHFRNLCCGRFAAAGARVVAVANLAISGKSKRQFVRADGCKNGGISRPHPGRLQPSIACGRILRRAICATSRQWQRLRHLEAVCVLFVLPRSTTLPSSAVSALTTVATTTVTTTAVAVAASALPATAVAFDAAALAFTAASVSFGPTTTTTATTASSGSAHGGSRWSLTDSACYSRRARHPGLALPPAVRGECGECGGGRHDGGSSECQGHAAATSA